MNIDMAASYSAHLLSAHPWLVLQPKKTEYLPPSYYDGILPDYLHNGLHDTWFLREFLKSHGARRCSPCLELGPGTGRCTQVLLAERPELYGSLDLIDQSAAMLQACFRRCGKKAFRRVHVEDATNAFWTLDQEYTTIVSMWSLSHSIHQQLHREGAQGVAAVTRSLKRLFSQLLAPGGRFFIMHFDALSEEQRISLRQRRRLYPFFGCDQQSPSFRILSETLASLRDDGTLEYECRHYQADPIVYRSLEHALEVYMNFHMEAELNHCDVTPEVIAQLEKDLRTLQRSDGTVPVKPAWFIFQGTRGCPNRRNNERDAEAGHVGSTPSFRS